MAKPKPDPNVAARLKSARLTLFKTAAEAAAALGINQVTLRTHEAGTRAPSLSDLQKYARRYGVALDWLISGKGDASDPRQSETLLADQYPIMGVVRDGAWLPDSDDSNVWPGWGPITSPAGVPEVVTYSDGRFPAELIEAMRVSTDKSDGPYLDGSIIFTVPSWEIGYRPGDHVLIVRARGGFAEWTLRRVVGKDNESVTFEALISDDPPFVRPPYTEALEVAVVGVVIGAIIRRPVPALSVIGRREVEAQRRLGRRGVDT